MRVDLQPPELAVEPWMCMQHEPVLAMALHPAWLEVGQRRSEMKKINYKTGEGDWGPAIRSASRWAT